MTGYFHAVLACIGVWVFENGNHSLVDDRWYLLLVHSDRLDDVGIVDGVGCDGFTRDRTEGADDREGVRSRYTYDAQGTASSGAQGADSISGVNQ